MKFRYSFIFVLCSTLLFGSPKLNLSEINQSILNLGQYISIKDHPKAKGVNMKLKAPIGWKVSDGDRPNVVKTFVKDGNTFMVLVKDNVTFFSRKEVRELLKDDKFLNEFVEEVSSILKSPQIIEQSVVTIDNYPAASFKVRGIIERSGIVIPVMIKCWFILYEDKIVYLQSMGIDNSNFKLLEILYLSIINSVIFPEQYN
jgi:hypothetical protein